MRTKTTILSAVALAAGLASASAQVYSANVVGYYNVVVPQAKFAMLATQLPNGTDYTVNSSLTNGVPDGSSLLIWQGSSYAPALTYFAGFGWYDADNNYATNALPPGVGAFFQNGDTVNPCTITVVGTVPQGSFANNVKQNFGLYALPSPVSTNIDSVLVNFPSGDGDSYLKWNVTNQSFDPGLTYFAGFGWYDQDNNPALAKPAVGEAFFYQHAPPNTASNWVFNFTVQ